MTDTTTTPDLAPFVYKRAAPPTSISREGMRHVVDAHLSSCEGSDLPRLLFCTCGDHGLTAASVCESCGRIVLLLIRRDSWCPHAEAAWGQSRPPFMRWWA